MHYRWEGDSLIIDCLIQPKSSADAIVGVLGERLKIRIKATPSDGKANKALLAYLADCFGVARSAVTIETGLGSRKKRVRIKNPSRLIAEIKRA